MSEKDENMEQSFNDAELQDIMNEIESLEKEFVEEEGAPSESSDEVEASADEEAPAEEVEVAQAEPVAEVVEEPVKEEPEAQEDSEDLANEAASYEAEEVEEPSNVVPIAEDKPAPISTGSGEGYMQFSGQGDMDMQLNFQLGEETATVSIKSGSLNVTLAGVQLELSENGCEVQMDGGVKFSVPLTANQAQGKKAA